MNIRRLISSRLPKEVDTRTSRLSLNTIITLFVVMQTTARINWSERFRLSGDAALETKDVLARGD